MNKSSSSRNEELMTDCGDHSHYKALFFFDGNFGYSLFYNYVGPHAGRTGFEYKNLRNKEVGDYCTVYANQSISCLPLTEMGGRGYNIQLLIRLGTSDTPDQKKFCPKIVMRSIDLRREMRNAGSRRHKAYLGFHKEEYDTVSKGNKNY